MPSRASYLVSFFLQNSFSPLIYCGGKVDAVQGVCLSGVFFFAKFFCLSSFIAMAKSRVFSFSCCLFLINFSHILLRMGVGFCNLLWKWIVVSAYVHSASCCLPLRPPQPICSILSLNRFCLSTNAWIHKHTHRQTLLHTHTHTWIHTLTQVNIRCWISDSLWDANILACKRFVCVCVAMCGRVLQFGAHEVGLCV